MGQLESAFNGANKKIDLLEAYTRADNLVVGGLPGVNISDAASANATDSTSTSESSITTEQAAIQLCRNKLNGPISASDISIAHRLKKPNSSTGPALVIVKL